MSGSQFNICILMSHDLYGPNGALQWAKQDMGVAGTAKS